MLERMKNAYEAFKKPLNISRKGDDPFNSPAFPSLSARNNFGSDLEQLTAYEKLEWISICVDRISRDLKRPFDFLNQKGEPIDRSRVNKQILDPIENGYFNDQFPQMIERVVSHTLLTGNAYFFKGMTSVFSSLNKIVDTLIPIRPDMISVITDRKRTELLGYKIRFPDGTEIRVKQNEIIHFSQNTIFNSFVGVGNVSKVRLIAEGETASQEYNNEFINGRATPSIVITSKEQISVEDHERKMDMLNAKYTGPQGLKLMYLAGGEDGDIKVQQMNISQEDMQFMEQKVHNRQTVISLFGLSPMTVGIPEGTNRATSEQIRLAHSADMNNRMEGLENTINQQFINMIDPNVFIRFKRYPTGDIERVKEMVDSGLITPNRGSEHLGEPIDPTNFERERFYINKNLIPMELSGQFNQQAENEPSKLKNLDLPAGVSDLTNPKNVNQIIVNFLKNSNSNKHFQARYLRASLVSRAKVEDRFAFEFSNFFKKQGARTILKFNEAFGGQKADPNFLRENPEKSVDIFFDIGFEDTEIDKNLTSMHTSGVQRGVNDIAKIAGVNINDNKSNPFVASAINRLVNNSKFLTMKSGVVAGLNLTTKKDIINIVVKGVESSLTINEISDNISNKFQQYEGHRARRIARTESRAAWDAGAEVSYNELDVRTVDVVGCDGASVAAGGDETTGDCNLKNIPIAQMNTLEFHPNHIGSILPTVEI